jgi:DNA-binding MarR family transcriptional regulator
LTAPRTTNTVANERAQASNHWIFGYFAIEAMMAKKKKTATAGAAKTTKQTRRKATLASYDLPDLPTLELAGRLDRVAKLTSRAVGDVARQHGATPSQLHIVERLARAPGGLTAKQLAAALAIRPGSLTGTLDALESRGILRRQAVKGDARRQQIVLLTGAKPLVDLLPAVDAAVSASLGGLATAELASLNNVMRSTEATVRARSSVPTPAALGGVSSAATHAAAEAAKPDNSERAKDKAMPATPTPAQVRAAAVEPTPAPAATKKNEDSDRWQRPERREQSEGSLGRGLFRIASRVISAADNRRRNKN